MEVEGGQKSEGTKERSMKMIRGMLSVLVLFSYCCGLFRATKCPLYQAITSTGVGVFAGRNFQEGEKVEFAPSFYTSAEAYANTIVGDYVVNHNATHGSLHGGYSLVMNHCDRSNVRYPDLDEVMRAKRNITKGEELCINYGKAWWELRGYAKSKPKRLDYDDDDDNEEEEDVQAQIIPGCPQIFTSLVPLNMNSNTDTAIRVDQKSEKKDADEATSPSSLSSNENWKKDDVIEGNFKNEGQWYRGTIEVENEDGSFNILYDDGDVEKGVKKALLRHAQPLSPPVYMKVVANVNISAGTTIEVSRSLIVPRRFWDNDQYEMDQDSYPNDVRHRIWRVLNDDSHSVGLLNYGMGAYYRAASNSIQSQDDLDNNHDYKYLVSNISIPNVIYREFKGVFNWKDVDSHECQPATLIEFIAKEDITVGTELVIDMFIDNDKTRMGERISKVQLDRECINQLISSDQKAMLGGFSPHPLLRRASFKSRDVENATLFWFNPGMPPNNNYTSTSMPPSMLERWGDLEIGEMLRANTYVGHRWVVQVNGSIVQEWHIPNDTDFKYDIMNFELLQSDLDFKTRSGNDNDTKKNIKEEL